MDLPRDVYRHLIFWEMSIPDIFNYATTNSQYLWILRDPEFWNEYLLRRRGSKILLFEIIQVDSPYLYNIYEKLGYGSLKFSTVNQLMRAGAYRLLRLYFNYHPNSSTLISIINFIRTSRYYSDEEYSRLARALGPIAAYLSSEESIEVSGSLFSANQQMLLLFSRLGLKFSNSLIYKIYSDLRANKWLESTEKLLYQELIENLYSTGVDDVSLQNLYIMEQLLSND